MNFTEEDFKSLEAKYPEAYWYLRAVALTRVLSEQETIIAELKKKE